jgi:hypothetical protein
MLIVLKENARSSARRQLPPVREGVQGGTILLFYQYREPAWAASEHKKALKDILAIATQHSITGRGRVATERANCTLSSANPLQMRAFCQALRDWDPIFNETDFKLTDGIPHENYLKVYRFAKPKPKSLWPMVWMVATRLPRSRNLPVNTWNKLPSTMKP